MRNLPGCPSSHPGSARRETDPARSRDLNETESRHSRCSLTCYNHVVINASLAQAEVVPQNLATGSFDRHVRDVKERQSLAFCACAHRFSAGVASQRHR